MPDETPGRSTRHNLRDNHDLHTPATMYHAMDKTRTSSCTTEKTDAAATEPLDFTTESNDSTATEPLNSTTSKPDLLASKSFKPELSGFTKDSRKTDS